MAFRDKHQTRPTLDQMALADPGIDVAIGLAWAYRTADVTGRDEDDATLPWSREPRPLGGRTDNFAEPGGTNGDDSLDGSDGDDSLDGLGGEDTLPGRGCVSRPPGRGRRGRGVLQSPAAARPDDRR